MIAMLKALPFGLLLTVLVALFVGSSGSRGGFLEIRHVEVMDIEFYWSWALSGCSTALAWFILLMMGD